MIVLLQRVTSAPVSVNGVRNAENGHRRRGLGLTFDTHIERPSRVKASNRADPL